MGGLKQSSDPGERDLRHLSERVANPHDRSMATTATLPATIRIRPIGTDDRAALGRFYERLSPDSLNRRFHGACRGIGDRAAGQFCGPDHEHREGLVAVVGPDGTAGTRIVGHLCLEPSEPGELEMAIAVADDFQRRGIGRALLVAAIDWARGHGIGRLRASMRCSNGAIISLVRSAGAAVTWRTLPGGGLEAIMAVGAARSTAA
jgi:GNAT superfamily N-acetyltransferase